MTASVPDTMRALLVSAPGSATVAELPIPQPGREDVLVRVVAAGICGSDLDLLDGTRPASYVRYPIVPGHEWSGIIESVGANVRDLVPGTPVVARGFRSCGRCARCREGHENLCAAEYAETGFTHQGAFAQYVLVPARPVHPLGAASNIVAAALLEPAAVAAEGLLRAPVRPGMRVAVVGAGAVGLLATMLLRQMSPGRLAVVDPSDARREAALRAGATDAWGPVASDVLTGRFDLVFEASGSPEGAVLAVRLARRGGAMILAGISGTGTPALDPDLLVVNALEVHGVFGASAVAWTWVTDLFSQGTLPTERLISHRYPLGRWHDAFEVVRRREAGSVKVLLEP